MTRKKFADRFPEGFDFEPRRVLSVSPFTLAELKQDTRDNTRVMWRRIYSSFLWMNNVNMHEVARTLFQDHASVHLAVRTVYTHMAGLFVDGTKNSIKSKAMKQALLDVIFCKDNLFILKSESISDDELTALISLENNLQQLQNAAL